MKKAHSHLYLSWQDIEILPRAELTEHEVQVLGPVASWHADAPLAVLRQFDSAPDQPQNSGRLTIQMALVSISHDGDYATATSLGFVGGAPLESAPAQRFVSGSTPEHHGLQLGSPKLRNESALAPEVTYESRSPSVSEERPKLDNGDRKSTRLNSSH